MALAFFSGIACEKSSDQEYLASSDMEYLASSDQVLEMGNMIESRGGVGTMEGRSGIRLRQQI